jgi:Mor family transcriptional regulator
MKYKILYHMLKKVKASIDGGTLQEDAWREIEKRGMDDLTTRREILRLIDMLPGDDPSVIRLQERLVQVHEDARLEIERRGMDDLSTRPEILRLIDMLPGDDPSVIRLQERLVQVHDAARLEIESKGMENLKKPEIVRLLENLHEDLPEYESLVQRLEERLMKMYDEVLKRPRGTREEEARHSIEFTGMENITKRRKILRWIQILGDDPLVKGLQDRLVQVHEDARLEIERRGMEKLTKNDMLRLREMLPDDEPLLFELQERLNLIWREEIQRKIYWRRLESFMIYDLRNMRDRMKAIARPDDPLLVSIQDKLVESIRARIRSEIDGKGGIEKVGGEDIISLQKLLPDLPPDDPLHEEFDNIVVLTIR